MLFYPLFFFRVLRGLSSKKRKMCDQRQTFLTGMLIVSYLSHVLPCVFSRVHICTYNYEEKCVPFQSTCLTMC